MLDPTELSGIARIIQLSIAPVFLLTGIGAILGVMTNRLSRVIDRARALEAKLETQGASAGSSEHLELARLGRRARLVGRAITLCTLTALLVSGVIAILFLSAFLHFDATIPVALLFIAAMAALFVGLLCFLSEIFVAMSGLKIGPK
jgi:hypothetical protein